MWFGPRPFLECWTSASSSLHSDVMGSGKPAVYSLVPADLGMCTMHVIPLGFSLPLLHGELGRDQDFQDFWKWKWKNEIVPRRPPVGSLCRPRLCARWSRDGGFSMFSQPLGWNPSAPYCRVNTMGLGQCLIDVSYLCTCNTLLVCLCVPVTILVPKLMRFL